MIGKIFGWFLLIALSIVFFGDYIWIPITVVILLVVIRLCADLFWKGKDKDWW